MKKLAIVTTHPIQYNAPWFRLLAQSNLVQVKVFYTWSQTKEAVKDRTFGKDIKWDIPLLEGYSYEFVNNVSKKPGSHHFFGIDCPTLIPDINTFKPDVLLIFGWNFKSHLMAMRYFKGKIPVWFRGDSTLLDEVGGFKTKLRRLILTRVYSYIDKALYVGEANKAYFLKHGIKAEELIFVPHAIDNNRFRDGSNTDYIDTAEQWRKQLGYKDDDIVVLFAGKFEAKKQPDFLINAFLKASLNTSESLKLLLVGNGPLENGLEKMVSHNPKIQFLPFQNQTKMPIIYRLGDVFCLPSKGPGETWGLAVNEAMASCKPAIVSSKVGCAIDLMKDHINGYVFSFDDINALQDLLESLTISELEKFGIQAEKDIQIYSFRAIVTAIETELSKLEPLKMSNQLCISCQL